MKRTIQWLRKRKDRTGNKQGKMRVRCKQGDRRVRCKQGDRIQEGEM